MELFHAGKGIRQTADLGSLPECQKQRGRQGLGDFTGNRKPHGLQLVKGRVGGEVVLPYTPWQEFKVLKWLKTNASSELPEIAEDLGYETEEAFTQEILRRVDEFEGERELGEDFDESDHEDEAAESDWDEEESESHWVEDELNAAESQEEASSETAVEEESSKC
jgi:cobalamin biosynthesis protein CobT